MESNTLGAALEKEHRDIDGGIEKFTTGISDGVNNSEPLQRAMNGLRRHIYLEETFLFPPLREAGMMMPIFVMLKEHGELWRTMSVIDSLLADQADAKALTDACESLLSQLDRHNSKEEPIIYTKADDILSSSASADLTQFLASGTTPDGWLCHGATA